MMYYTVIDIYGKKQSDVYLIFFKSYTKQGVITMH
jgi:hypothetical protein